MSLFQTTPEEQVQISVIAAAMNSVALPAVFIAGICELAKNDQGVFELMALWRDTAEDAEERAAIEADLQDHLDEAREAPALPVKKPNIPFDDLGNVGSHIEEHKKRLRDIIDRHGGVSAVARKCGMPQPSLSRMLTSTSMPRRTTLYRIANALGISEHEIVGEWIR
jgi:DNA-binding phage protein